MTIEAAAAFTKGDEQEEISRLRFASLEMTKG